MDRGDSLTLTVGTRTMTYNISGDEGGTVPTTPGAVIESLRRAAEASGLFSQMVSFGVDPADPSRLIMTPLTANPGRIELSARDRSDVNDQSIQVTLSQEPRPALPERVEFFESLQELSTMLRGGTQDQIQGKLDHLDQMLDSVTLSLADIGAEMGSIQDEIEINESVKLQLESTLSGQEDLDYASAITELQAKMMSLEAAQSSFAKISQLSVFDYIR